VSENVAAGPDGVGVRADLAYTLEARTVPPAVAFNCKSSDPARGVTGDITTTLRAMASTTSHQNGGGHLAFASGAAVRRLTPRECERLQGFPDDYTLIPWRKGLSPDGLRYRALGNSMAVPVMRWIGDRIDAVEHGSAA
jgi:DNA (cytosine-5)-methyltransferase 1